MARGKQTCKILKEIRRQIAEANDIEFVTSECRYKGDCLGTCPKCEAEVRYLEQQLRSRQLAGKLVNLAGISAGAIAMLAPLAVQSQIPDTSFTKDCVATQEFADTVIVTDTIIVKGVVLDGDTLQDGTISREPMVGAVIINPRTRIGTSTDIDGNFQIKVCKGDTLEISYIGYKKQSVIVLDDDDAPLEIMLNSDDSLILGELAAVSVGAISAYYDRDNMLDLYIVDENKKPLPYDSVTIKRVYFDEDGEEDSDYLDPVWIEEKGVFRFYWNEDSDFQDDDGKPLKEAILRIEVDGYDNPKTIKVKYPKRNTKKTIKFKHDKK